MMAVYVDELKDYPPKGLWCHLTADSPEELHRFARQIGLQRRWCSDVTQPRQRILHYDLRGERKRRQALEAGAIFIPGIEQVRARIAAEKAQQAAEAPAGSPAQTSLWSAD